jgi:hypothetical protein
MSEEYNYVVESDITIRSVDKPIPGRQVLAVFHSLDSAYHFIEKYFEDTKMLHTYFSRRYLCSREDLEENINNGKSVAINIVLGQFEDMIYINKVEV